MKGTTFMNVDVSRVVGGNRFRNLLQMMLVCLVGCMLLGGCKKASLLQSKSANAAPAKPKPTKQVSAPSIESSAPVGVKRVLVGTVQSHRKVVVSPQIGGVIKKIYAKKGDYVKKNQRLLWIECQDYRNMTEQVKGQIAVAKASLQLAQTQAQNARRDYTRFLALRRKRSISAYQMDKLKAGRDLTAAQFVLAQKQLQVALIGLKVAMRRQRNCLTRAPFAGVVSNRMLDEGSVARAMPPSNVMVIEEIDPIVIEVPVGEMYLREFKQATSVSFVIPSLGKTSVVELSKRDLLNSLMPTINPYNRAATLRFSLPNKDRKLRPGMSAELHITLQTQ
ncbi:MAG: efflux RND transporter periplasmic adaptor subunit [Deltaproteobacteria bacterium]|nr:MAG: efflux RND transporter periplasmic adaptor subunit [Deltaproteobacteria bacterium]